MSTTPVSWTWEENKAFEIGLADYLRKESEEEFQQIAAMVPSKTMEQVKYDHYKILVEDLQKIEDGLVPLPNYIDAEQSDNESEESDSESTESDNESVGSSSIKE